MNKSKSLGDIKSEVESTICDLSSITGQVSTTIRNNMNGILIKLQELTKEVDRLTKENKTLNEQLESTMGIKSKKPKPKG